jgi:hypothetical protein
MAAFGEAPDLPVESVTIRSDPSEGLTSSYESGSGNGSGHHVSRPAALAVDAVGNIYCASRPLDGRWNAVFCT